MEFNATFLITAISFVIFTLIMNCIFYKPISNIIQKRNEYINETDKATLEINNRTDKIIKDRDEKIAKSLDESKKIVAEKTETSNEKASEMTKSAKKEVSEKIIESKKELQLNAKDLDTNMKPQINSLAEIIASKVLEN